MKMANVKFAFAWSDDKLHFRTAKRYHITHCELRCACPSEKPILK